MRRSAGIPVDLPTDLMLRAEAVDRVREVAGRRARIDAMPPGSQGTRGDTGPGDGSVDNFNRYAKHVPRAALGKDVTRVRRIGLELAPQP